MCNIVKHGFERLGYEDSHACYYTLVNTLLFIIINARRAFARGLQYFVCLFVCYQSPGFFSRLNDKLDIPACSSLVFLGFQLTDFDKG